jgi:prepilin-type N-terminal cleavage/methylation domain-containing protein
MRRFKSGFTIPELVIVILIGSILASIAIRSAGPVLTQTSVRSAARTFGALHARARAHAIERGSIARLRVDATQDRVSVTVGSDTIEVVDFGESQSVDIQASVPTITLCFNPRGFGERGCSSFDTGVEIAFAQGAEVSEVRLWPLGQLVL